MDDAGARAHAAVDARADVHCAFDLDVRIALDVDVDLDVDLDVDPDLDLDLLVLMDVEAPAPVRLAAAQSLPPSGAVVSALASIDPSRLSPADTLSWLQALQGCRSLLAALEAEGLVAAAGPAPTVNSYVVGADQVDSSEEAASGTGRVVQIEDAAAEEVAAALRWSPRTARTRIMQARLLAGPHAPTRRALRGGRVTASHVAALGRELARLPRAADGRTDDPAYADACAGVLAAVLPFASTHTPAETARRARGAVETIDPQGSDRRRQQARSACDVDVMDDLDGQSVLSARMDTTEAHAVLDAVLSLAHDERFAAGCHVSAGQRRVAALTTLVLGDRGRTDRHDGDTTEVSARGVATQTESVMIEAARANAQIGVVVSLETILGLSQQPGTLEGSGPIGAGAVLDLLRECGSGSAMYRLVVDPEGRLLDVGRERYEISDAQREFVARRDVTCRFPGCGARADRCQVDHAIGWMDGGATDVANLGALCARHHNLKTHGGWRIEDSQADGGCVWRSPRLARYEHEPAALLPPGLPPPALPPPL